MPTPSLQSYYQQFKTQDKPIELTEQQVECIEALLGPDWRWVIWAGAVRAGKTWGATLGLMIHALKYEYPLLLLGGKTLQTIKGNTTGPVQHWAKALGLPFRYDNQLSAYRVGNQIWEIRGLDKSDSYSTIQGREYCGVFVDELTAIHKSSWDMILTRTSAPGFKGVVTFNKESPTHWAKEAVFENTESLRALLIESTMADNPLLDEEYTKTFDDNILTHYQRVRWIENQWATADGLVYPFSEHANKPDEPGGVVVGCDYGESGTTAAVFLQRQGDSWIVIGEYGYVARIQGKRTPEQHVKAIVSKANEMGGAVLNVHIDPTAISMKDAFKKAHVRVTNGWTNEKGYDWTNGALQRGHVKIDKQRCNGLISEMENLIYNPKTDKPDGDCPDHYTDALRYAVVGVRAGGIGQNIATAEVLR